MYTHKVSLSEKVSCGVFSHVTQDRFDIDIAKIYAPPNQIYGYAPGFSVFWGLKIN